MNACCTYVHIPLLDNLRLINNSVNVYLKGYAPLDAIPVDAWKMYPTLTATRNGTKELEILRDIICQSSRRNS